MAISGKTLLITGASSGLGRGVALAFSKGGNNLVVTARRRELLDGLAKEIEANGSRALVCVNDATDTDAAKRVVDEAIATFGHLDIALLNVGGGTALSTDHPKATAAKVLEVMRRNYDSLVNFLVPVAAHMRERGTGTIAYTGSPAGEFGLPKSGPYSAAKAGARVLFDTFRIEHAGTGVRFVGLFPGFTHTDALDPREVPVKSLIIDVDRAVAEMTWAIERGARRHMFPKRMRWLINFAKALPDAWREWVLSRGAIADRKRRATKTAG